MTLQVGDANANPVFTDVTATGSPGAAQVTVTATLRGQSTATVQVTGIGSMTLTFEGTTDGTNYDPLLATPIAGGAAVSTTTANGHWVNISVAGLASFRVRVSAYTSGTATVTIVASQGSAGANYTAAGLSKVDVASVNGTALGTPTNFGTTPTAVVAASVNASLFSGTTALGTPNTFGTTAPTGNALGVNASLFSGTTVLGTPNTFGTTAPTGAALGCNVSPFIGTTLAVAASAGVQKVGISGATGATMDGAIAAVPPANALQIGVKAATANPANATAGNQVAIMADKAGRIVVTQGNVRELIGNISNAAITTTTETTIIAAGGAGVFNDITHLTLTNTGVATLVSVKDATAGTTRWVGLVAATTGTEDIHFNPPLMQATANNNWTATCTTTASSTIISCNFVKNT